jgi:hypothetical protein
VSHVDLDSLKQNVYFVTATLDERYTWQKIPAEDLPGLGITDEADRYRITGCAHREADRDGDTCGHCGESIKSPHTRWSTKGSRKK